MPRLLCETPDTPSDERHGSREGHFWKDLELGAVTPIGFKAQVAAGGKGKAKRESK